MGKRLSLTLVAGCLIGVLPAHAQPPGEVGPAPVAEPLPYPQTMNYSVPRKPWVPPYMAKEAPPCIEGDTPNSWSNIAPPEKTYADCPGWYVQGGTVMFLRNRNAAAPAVYQQAAPPGAETGFPTPPGAEVFGTYSDVSPGYHWGLVGTVGYHWDDEALEFVALWLPKSTTSENYNLPQQLNTPFYNAPVTFAGNNGMFRDADYASLRFDETLLSFQLNGRFCVDWHPCLELIVGARYTDLSEGLYFSTVDETQQPQFTATYVSKTQNRIFGPQLGAEWFKMLHKCVGVGANIKGMVGANWSTTNLYLQRGDGQTAFNTSRDSRGFAQVYDGGLFVDIYFMERARFRAGYNFLWLNGIAEAVGQIDYNLANTQGHISNNGNAYYYGPLFELHLLF